MDRPARRRRRRQPRSRSSTNASTTISSAVNAVIQKTIVSSEKDIALYLEACLKEGGDDPAFIAAALGDIARGRSVCPKTANIR